ncbi:MAG: hypothetical protein IIW75_01980 [Bacteroidaceae bacterium]|nr:hypothetical protein [Bacteroidaceae bacterium]
MVKRSTGVARTVWVAKSECCQKQYYSNIGFLTWLKLLALAAKSQTSLVFAHLRVTFRRWRGITFAKGYSANFAAYNGNIKEKPALCEQQSLLAANEEKEWVIFSYEKNI